MLLKLTAQRLREAGACPEGIEAFRAAFGDQAEVEWTRDEQIKLLRGPLGRYVGWACREGLLPLWSLRGADLRGAKACLCNGVSCVRLQETLAAAGWAPGADELLARVPVPAPGSTAETRPTSPA